MKNFKQLMYQYHEQNKMSLYHLYTDRQIYYSSISSSEQPIEDEKLFRYRAITFPDAGADASAPVDSGGVSLAAGSQDIGNQSFPSQGLRGLVSPAAWRSRERFFRKLTKRPKGYP